MSYVSQCLKLCIDHECGQNLFRKFFKSYQNYYVVTHEDVLCLKIYIKQLAKKNQYTNSDFVINNNASNDIIFSMA